MSQVLQGHFPAGLSRIAGQRSMAVQRSAGKAVQLPPHLAFRARGPGQPLPGPVLARMEDFFNADFSGVRVHVGPEASSIGALAFTLGSQIHFSPGQYDPQTQRGQRLLGHELTHVLQQRAGRARNPFGSGIAVLQDPLLEAEAERMGLRASALPVRVAVPVPRSVAPPAAGHPLQKKPGGTLQAYFKIPGNRVFTAAPPRPPRQHHAYLGTGVTFPAQVGSDDTDHFRTATNAANVQNRTGRPLRVSDDGQMAIEDTHLRSRQAKAFFAAPAVIRQGNQGLQEVSSTYGIRAVHPRQTLTVVMGGTRNQLVKVEPYVRATRATLATGQQNCNDFASSLTGRLSGTLVPVASQENLPGASEWGYGLSLPLAFAEYIAQNLGAVEEEDRLDLRSRTAFRNSIPGTTQGERLAINRVGASYVNALGRRGARNLTRRLGVNESAAPQAGDAFVVTSVAAPDAQGRVRDAASGRRFTPQWSYHWAGVVAVSGSDRVTLENYARHDATGPANNVDPRWYFQMYGQGEGQSFHEASEATGGFANPLTLAVRNRNRRPTSYLGRLWNGTYSREDVAAGVTLTVGALWAASQVYNSIYGT